MEVHTATQQQTKISREEAWKGYDEIRANKKQLPITGWRCGLLRRQRAIKDLFFVLKTYKSIPKSIRVFKAVRKLKARVSGNNSITKLVRIENKYFWRLHIPGWGSPLYDAFLASELNRIEKLDRPAYRLANAFVAVTKKCPLKCEHCFEWENLNQAEKLTVTDLEQIVAHLQEIGTATIDFTGGEPMLRIKELLPIMEKYCEKSAFFMLTSGFNFTAENARKLKQARLTGVMVSIDHYDPEKHDAFRGLEGSFRQALYAIKHSIEQDFVTVMSVCLTRETANKDFLHRYMELAKELGVAFVQLLEPKAVGHYVGKDVLLRSEHINCMEAFYTQMNNDPAFSDFPVVIYHGYYQRRIGCLSAGSRSVYIDTNGDILACPFCHIKAGSAQEKGYAAVIDKMAAEGCGPYKLRTRENTE